MAIGSGTGHSALTRHASEGKIGETVGLNLRNAGDYQGVTEIVVLKITFVIHKYLAKLTVFTVFYHIYLKKSRTTLDKS